MEKLWWVVGLWGKLHQLWNFIHVILTTMCLEAAVLVSYTHTQPFWSFKDANNSVQHNGRLRQASTQTQRQQGKNTMRPVTSVVLQTKKHAKSPDWRQIPLLQSCPGLIVFSINKSRNQNPGFVIVDFCESDGFNGTRGHKLFSLPFSQSRFHSEVWHELFFLAKISFEASLTGVFYFRSKVICRLPWMRLEFSKNAVGRQ